MTRSFRDDGGISKRLYTTKARRARNSFAKTDLRDLRFFVVTVVRLSQMQILLVGYGKMGRMVEGLAGEYGCEVAG
jgi:hypothetical protein